MRLMVSRSVLQNETEMLNRAESYYGSTDKIFEFDGVSSPTSTGVLVKLANWLNDTITRLDYKECRFINPNDELTFEVVIDPSVFGKSYTLKGAIGYRRSWHAVLMQYRHPDKVVAAALGVGPFGYVSSACRVIGL